jgi:GDP-4-dehydro-6-deoxy-D-mannose reductase
MRALITGADGFVGQHLCELLLASGAEVHGAVRGDSPLLHYLTPVEAGRVQWHTGLDLADAAGWRTLVAAVVPDLVFHLAGLALPTAANADLPLAFETNVFGTVNLLVALSAERAGRPSYDPAVLVAGSAAAYGNAARTAVPLREEQPLEPLDGYGISKAAQEMVARQHALEHGMRVVVARSFNHTGPGQLPPYVVPEWAAALGRIRAGTEQPVLRVGNIDVERDFLDVRDVVRAYLALARCVDGFEVFNVCSGTPLSLRRLLAGLQDAMGTSAEVTVDPARLRGSEVTSVWGSAARLHARTGWRPEIPLDVTLRDVAAVCAHEPLPTPGA